MSIASRIEAIEEHIGDIYDTLTLGGADLTNVNKNIVNVKDQLKDRYLDYMNNGTETIWNNWEKVTGEGTSLSLSPTLQAPMKNILKGNTSQTGTSTPSSPIPVNVVSGDNEIVVCGKNLFDSNAETYNGYTTGNEGSTIGYSSSVNTISYKKCAYVKAGETYTLSWAINTPKLASNRDIRIVDDDSKVLQIFTYLNTNNNRTYTFTPSSSGWVYAGLDANATEPQIELGSATTYEPYQGNTYNIDLPEGMELCKIGNYQDYIYKEDDKWYLHKEIGKVIFTGSENENWQRYGAYGDGYLFYIDNMTNALVPDVSKIGYGYGLSNYFNWTDKRDETAVSPYIRFQFSNGKRLYLSFTTDMTLENFKTWLGTNNVTLYYVLATPTTTEITYQPLIDQLNLLEQATSKENQTNILQVNNDLPFIINSTMLKEE